MIHSKKHLHCLPLMAKNPNHFFFSFQAVISKRDPSSELILFLTNFSRLWFIHLLWEDKVLTQCVVPWVPTAAPGLSFDFKASTNYNNIIKQLLYRAIDL